MRRSSTMLSNTQSGLIFAKDTKDKERMFTIEVGEGTENSYSEVEESTEHRSTITSSTLEPGTIL